MCGPVEAAVPLSPPKRIDRAAETDAVLPQRALGACLARSLVSAAGAYRCSRLQLQLRYSDRRFRWRVRVANVVDADAGQSRVVIVIAIIIWLSRRHH